MAADTAAGRQRTADVHRASTVGRWAGAAALCLTVAVYAWYSHGALERRVAVLEAAVADMQRQLRTEYPSAGGIADAAAAAAAQGFDGQALRNKRDATSGQCSCPPGKRTVHILSIRVGRVLRPPLNAYI